MVEQLIQILQAVRIEYTAEDVADILWLANILDEQNNAGSTKTSNTNSDDADKNLKNESKSIPLPLDKDVPISSIPEQNTALFTPGEDDPSISKRKVLPFGSPTAPALPQALEISKSLRPFRRRVRSRTFFSLDVDQTIKQFEASNRKLWIPFLRPSLERWLDFAIVMDDSPSMIIWKDTIHEFRKVLENTGAFRNIYSYNLHRDSTGYKISSPNRRIFRNPEELIDTSGNRVILIVTDCIDEMWDSTDISGLVRRWGSTNHVAIAQVLPRRMWGQTALANYAFELLRLAGYSSTLKIHNRSYRPDFIQLGAPKRLKAPIASVPKTSTVAVPIFTLEPRSLGLWAQMVMGNKDIRVTGCLFPIIASEGEADDADLGSTSTHERFNYFRKSASPNARKLAGLFACSPVLTLTIMRIIQRVMLPESSQADLAEVYLSGLLKRSRVLSENSDPNDVLYEFLPEILDSLQEGIAISVTVQVFMEVSKFIERNEGLGRTFQVLMEGGQDTGSIADVSKPFAHIGSKSLKRLGGNYAQMADDRLLQREARIIEAVRSAMNQRVMEIDLSNQQMASLPSLLTKYTDLKRLNLQGNRLRYLPASLKNLVNLEYLDLRDNLLPIPPEILARTDEPKNILEYYFSLANTARKFINEVKLLVLGQGSVGKTSLIQRLVSNKYDPTEQKTEGIEIRRWSVKAPSPNIDTSEIHVNIWNFGGQEIMHATHQFFLTKRSLYLLVLDSRLTQEENRVEYWLKIIQSFGGDSPVIIVGNKTDQHPLDIDRTGLRKKYPNVVNIIETSAASGAGIESLQNSIVDQVYQLPYVQDQLPVSWANVKRELEILSHNKNFVTADEYIELCIKNDVVDETSQNTLLALLHDTGLILLFQDDPRLQSLGILNPEWVTTGVYRILNSRVAFQNKGVLTISMLDEILNQPEYPRNKRIFIVEMMKKFELCYDLEPDRTFLIPDLLPKDEPQINFSGTPLLQYVYPVLPASIMARLLVRMNQHIHNQMVWRSGAVLKIGENRALVQADTEDRRINIAIDGPTHTRRDVLSAITYQLDEIHASIKQLQPQKRVPIPDRPEIEPIDYQKLLEAERAGDEVILTQSHGSSVSVNVRELLSGINIETERGRRTGPTTNIYIGGDMSIGELDINNEIQNSYAKVETADIGQELKETLRQLTDAVGAMSKTLKHAQAVEALEDLTKLIGEVTKPSPREKWVSVSIDGLIKAAEGLGTLGEPVVNLSRRILSLLIGQ